MHECVSSDTLVHRREELLFTPVEIHSTGMSDFKRGTETFLTKVWAGYRITIYEEIRESLGIEIGDRVRVTVRKEKS